jgi:hypothetical protein
LTIKLWGVRVPTGEMPVTNVAKWDTWQRNAKITWNVLFAKRSVTVQERAGAQNLGRP